MSGCPTTDVATYENCGGPPQGLLAYGSIGNGKLDTWITNAANQSKPASSNASYLVTCAAMLRARGLIYYKSNPGDCPKPSPISGLPGGQIVGLSGSAASGIISGIGAAGILSGAATLGITSAISLGVAGIEDIFSHHAQAVANEQATICAVAGYVNPLVQQIDAAVRSGQISPAQGITYITQVMNQAKSGLATIQKVCNAACYYSGFCQAHIYFVANYYPYIAPQAPSAAAPGQAPAIFGSAPGGVLLTGTSPAPAPPIRSVSPAGVTAGGTVLAPPNNQSFTVPSSSSSRPADYLNAGYNQQTGQSGQQAPVPPSGVDWQTLAAIATVIGVVVLVITKGKVSV